MLRRRRAKVSPELASAFRSFLAALASVEEAKAALAAAAPRGRGAGLPLAEALMGFESGLAAAREGMDGWQEASVSAEWLRCRRGLEEVARRAERLRLGVEPGGYEHLYGALGDLMEPLEAFGLARVRFQELGV